MEYARTLASHILAMNASEGKFWKGPLKPQILRLRKKYINDIFLKYIDGVTSIGFEKTHIVKFCIILK